MADPDDDGSVVSGTPCGKPAGAYKTALFRAYFANGQVKQVESSVQANASPAPDPATFTYDADGNQVTVTTHKGGIIGTKFEWYDGADRLVQVQEPSDSRTWTPAPQATANASPMPYDLSGPLLTRYYYDLTVGAAVSFANGVPFHAHGDLFKTVQYLPVTGGYSWQDVRGNAYDALDRPTTGYSYAPGDSTVHTSSASYDAGGYLGFETQSCNGANECASTTYDALGRALQVAFSGGQGEPTKTLSYDPDGRTVAVQSSVYGTLSYSFDAEGHVVTSVEPNQGGVTSPATLTYEYYPNGWKKDMQVSSAGWTQTSTPAFQYFYRPDGKVAHEQFNDMGLVNHSGDQARDFTWTYTAGGRLTSTTDPYRNPSHTYTYDTYGRTQTYTLAAGSYSGITYDDENEITNNGKVSYQYSIRGELAAQNVAPSNTTFHAQSDYGVMINRTFACVNNQNPPPTQFCDYQTWDSNTVDFKEGVRTGFVNGDDGPSQNKSWTYDSAGRESSTTGANSYIFGSFVRAFDPENHLLSQAYTSWAVGNDPRDKYCTQTYGGLRVQYAWGPNGHPILMGSSPISTVSPYTPPPASQVQSDTLHWDGGTLLFTTNASGQVDDIKVGVLADLTPLDPVYPRFTIWDRDMSGAIVSSHNDTGFGSWTASDPYIRACIGGAGAPATYATPFPNFIGPVMFAGGTHPGGSTPATSLVGQGGLIAEPRTDGINDGYNTIQGVRDYDSTQNAWTTPDALPGVVSDPTSQRRYVWNGNNPISYADPSGFYTIAEGASDADKKTIQENAEVVRQHAQASADYWSKQKGQDAANKAKAFQKLADDMTFGKGNMVIHAYNDSNDDKGGYVYPQVGTNDVYLNMAKGDQQNTMAIEAFNSEFQQTGNPYFSGMEKAIINDKTIPIGESDTDRFVDQYVNQFFRQDSGGNPPQVLPYNGDNG